MNRDILSLLRPHIAHIKPYASARSEYSGQASIMLDANENPYGAVIPDALNRYPDPLQKALKKKIGEIKHIAVDKVFIGNGSDEPIDLLIRAFCEPGKDKVILLPPTYGMYETAATINNVEVVTVPLLPGFQPDVEGIRHRIDAHTKILFICSPNNPTGNLMREEDILTLVRDFPGIVVIDEAYIDFTDQASWAGKIDEYPQIVVLQTLSKAWGLANIRLGMAFAHPALVGVLNNIKAPYNVNGVTQKLALYALQQEAKMHEYVQDILSQRALLADRLTELPVVKHIYPSDANFLLIKVEDANDLYHYLTKKGIVVRNRTKEPLCEGCLRISVGTPGENDHLIDALKVYGR